MSRFPHAEDPVQNRTSGRRWFIVGLLSVGVMIAYIDRANLSVVLALQEFKEFFHLSDKNRGALNAAFFFSYAFLQIPAGWIVDRYGVKFPYTVGFLFWGLVSAATSLAGSVAHLIGLRILLGLGESVVAPATSRWIQFHFAEQERGFAFGLYLVGANVGLAGGALIVAWLISTSGWRAMFLILGLGSLLWLVPWTVAMKDEPKATVGASKGPFSSGAAVKDLMMSPVFGGLIVGTFAYNYFFYFCMTWMPAYLVEQRNLSLRLMGFYQMLSFGGLAFMAIFAGWLADRMIARGARPIWVRKGFVIAGFLMASTEVLGAQTGSTTVALFFAVFSLTGLGLATSNCWVLTQTLVPGTVIGRAIGIQNFVANLAGILAPLITAWLKQATASYQAPLQVIWLFLLIGLASYVFLVREEYVPITL